MNSRPASSPSEAYAGFYKVIAPLIMSSGVGDGQTTACVMAQAATIDALRRGKTLNRPTDQMECACPVLRRLAISINDAGWWASNEERTEHLRPLIPLLLDSRGDLARTDKRAALVADRAVRVLTPMRLDWIAAHRKNEELKAKALAGAKELRELPAIVDVATANGAREACERLRSSASADASASAYAYAYAYADASASAYAYAYAYAYADASAYAYADASAYADADAYADASVSAYAYASAYADADASAYADADAYAYAYADVKAQRLAYRNAALQLFRDCAALT